MFSSTIVSFGFSSTIVSFGFSTIMSEESEDPTVSVVGVEVFDSVFSVGEIIGEGCSS